MVAMNPEFVENPSAPSQEGLMQQLLEVSTDGMFDWHIPSRTCTFSPRLYAMLGYGPEGFPGTEDGWRERMHPDEKELVQQALERHFADPQTPYQVEFRVRHRDGSWKWILVRGKVVEFEPDGTPRRMIGTHVDITKLKLAQDRYQQLFSNMASAFALHEAILDESGNLVDYRFLEVNPAFEKQTGIPASIIVGKRVRDMVPEVPPSWLERYGTVVATGNPLRYEEFATPLERWVEVQVYRPAPGQFAILMTDIHERKRQESALARSEEHFRLLADNSLDIVLRLSIAGEYLWASPSIKAILGLDPESLVGTSSLARIHPEDLPLVAWAMEAALRTMEPQKIVYRHLVESGRVVWLESIGKAILDPVTGKPAEFLVSSRDITERKEAERKIKELASFNQQLVDTTGGIIVVFDIHGTIQRFNHAAEDLLGWKEEEVLGKKFYDVFVPESRREQVSRLFPQQVPHFQPRRFENDWLHRDGSMRWIAWANTPLFGESGEPELIVCTGIDRTPYKLAERQILDLNGSLERRVSERTKELQSAMDELESFSYTVSHDLRSPLRAIDGFGLALAEEASHLLTPEMSTYLDRIRAASRRMTQLIDGLLELSRSNRLPLQKLPVDASLIAREILDGFANQEPTRNLSGRIEPGIILQADPVLLRSILENLLGNAWKYTSLRVPSHIEVTSFSRQERKWLQVRDNGEGFSMDHAEKLFGTFQRLHSDPRFPGTGIGLATVRKLVERHGGEVEGEGVPGQGAAFRFTLDPVSSER